MPRASAPEIAIGNVAGVPRTSLFLDRQAHDEFAAEVLAGTVRGHRVAVCFDELSDGEKCFFLCAVVLAANQAYGPLLTFWDEPDNHLAMAEVSHFVMALRRAFESAGQVLITSHGAETLRSFSDDNTWVLDRKSHLEPTIIRPLTDLKIEGGVVQAMLSGELQA